MSAAPVTIRVQAEDFDLQSEIDLLTVGRGEIGAVVTFTGLCRHEGGRLEALVARSVMYELVGHGEEIMLDGTLVFALRSRGEVYPIMPADSLKRLSA